MCGLSHVSGRQAIILKSSQATFLTNRQESPQDQVRPKKVPTIPVDGLTMKRVHQTGHQAVHQKPKTMRPSPHFGGAMELEVLVVEDDQAVEVLLEVEDK